MKKLVCIVFMGSVALVAACSSGNSGSGATAGQQCTTVMNAFCTHAVNDCQETGTVADCVNAGVDACCGSKCNVTATSSESSIDTCVSAMKAMSCSDVAAQNPPAVCHGVVTITGLGPSLDLSSFGAQISSTE